MRDLQERVDIVDIVFELLGVALCKLSSFLDHVNQI